MKNRKLVMSLLGIVGLANFTMVLLSVASRVDVTRRIEYNILSLAEIKHIKEFKKVIRVGDEKLKGNVSTYTGYNCSSQRPNTTVAGHINGSAIEGLPEGKQVNETGGSRSSVSVVDMFRSINTNWSFNVEQANRLRSDLEKYCKTSEQFVITQKIVNLNINGTLKHDGPKKWLINVTLDEYNRLPKENPYNKGAFKKCSVVGNSGILLGSKCGKVIDATNFIIRLNMGRLFNYTEDVGSKTDLITCNPSMFASNYSRFNKNGARKYKDDLIMQFENATAYTTGFMYRSLRKTTFRAQDIHKSVNSDVIFAYSRHISSVKGFYRKKYGIKEKFVSSGLLMFSTALSFCDEVHLFGFWPFAEDPDGKPLQYHYYEKYAYMKQVHNMAAEFETLVNLHNKGAIRLHVGKCDS
ncbi:CMP-N-acetylneuraminate-poly-alpha-2,8-sialyltransferase-like [Ptychodera flava]|uniref:CMP-N-acetylneuraminate-poly-alpha-2, 8-sialyltransferase-like n=1 Tax=Ptychodera flava TaxID=63121 RepID=UPI00396A8BE4